MSAASLFARKPVTWLGGLLMAAIIPLALALMPTPAKANVDCAVTAQGLDFGSTSSGTGTISFLCTKYNSQAVSFTLCAARGMPSWPGTTSQPIMRSNANGTLNYNVYKDVAATQVWTAFSPITRTVTIPSGTNRTASGSFTVYGRIPAGQTAAPGSYSGQFYSTILGIQTNGSNCLNSASLPFQFSGRQFTLDSFASVVNQCRIVALGNADLGSVGANSGPVTGLTTLSVNCPSGTPYNIGLLPSNGNTTGAGQLSGTGNNTDQPNYQLRKTSPTGPAWGNTASTSGAGNGVGATGNGSDQSYPIYISVPSTSVAPDTYRDTVRVTVHF